MSAFTVSLTSAVSVAKPRVGRVSRTTGGRRASQHITAAMNVDSVVPLGNRILVIADAKEAQSKGGILLPSANQQGGPGSSMTGKVKSVGLEVKTVKANDAVLINGFAGSEVEFEGGLKGKFITEEDVLAVLS